MGERTHRLGITLTAFGWVTLSVVALVFMPEVALWVTALSSLPLVVVLGVGYFPDPPSCAPRSVDANVSHDG